MCDGNGPPTWQATASVDTMSTTIVFGGGSVALREIAVTASLGHFSRPRFGWSVSAGPIVAGSIEGRDTRGGAALGCTVTWLPVYERTGRPFVGFSASAGTALIRGRADDGSARLWSAWDLRGGMIAGKTFAKHVVPYAAARVFGGPVFWHRGGASVTGGDRYHVTAGVGLTLRLPARFDLTFEVMALGEQSATAGATRHF